VFSREEGLRVGQQDQTLRQLRKRLGELDEATQQRVKDLPIERLEDLAEALLDFTRMPDLHDWLQSAL